MIFRFSNLLEHTYEPLNKIEISRPALKNNYLYLNSLRKNIKIAPVLKSNAYGHGLIIIAKELDQYQPPFFCVDSLYEAYELLKYRIKTPILIMGCFNPRSLQTKRLPFSFTVFTKKQLMAINRYQPQAKVHIFVDTGMNREGILFNQLESYLTYITSKTQLTVEGLMSHLAMSEKPDDVYTKKQIVLFNTALNMIKGKHIFPKWIHLANSSGIINSHQYGNVLGNVSRTGLALYGIDPAGKNRKLMPVLRLITHIVGIKDVEKGDSVGYNFFFRAQKKMRIAIIPLGYHDGVDLRLCNIGCVQANNEYCPIVGKVSMNITAIDVSNIPNIHFGQEVTVYSKRPEDRNSIENTAGLVKTIPYELLVHLAPSTKRVMV